MYVYYRIAGSLRHYNKIKKIALHFFFGSINLQSTKPHQLLHNKVNAKKKKPTKYQYLRNKE